MARSAVVWSGLGLVAAAVVAGVTAYGVWYSQRYPRQIVATGTVRAAIDGRPRTLKTRDVAINGVVFQEVELPGGSWLGCAGDCAAAVRDWGDGFWDKQERNR